VEPLLPWQLQEELRKGSPDLVLLDVRTPQEFKWFHIPGAQNVPLTEGWGKALQVPKTKTVVVICMTGHRSPLVAYRLHKEGFPKVYNLTWGMLGWELWKKVAARLGGGEPKPKARWVSGEGLTPGGKFLPYEVST